MQETVKDKGKKISAPAKNKKFLKSGSTYKNQKGKNSPAATIKIIAEVSRLILIAVQNTAWLFLNCSSILRGRSLSALLPKNISITREKLETTRAKSAAAKSPRQNKAREPGWSIK